MVLSKTNTDKICFPSGSKSSSAVAQNHKSSSISKKLQLYIYRYNLWTGLYMLEPRERIAINTLFGFLFLVWCWYTNMFLRGLLNGWNQATFTTTTADSA
mmetsp:Transcript_1241/g.1161  ORF Transcript_1241/g.1161 Transcript_1241/m.1161 type:complete len:100 (-) Transcript_1241:168-467(-)